MAWIITIDKIAAAKASYTLTDWFTFTEDRTNA